MTPDGFVDLHGPIEKYCAGYLTASGITTGALREGYGWKLKDLDRLVSHTAWATMTEQALMNVEGQLASNYANVAKLWESYKERLDAFRGVAKNDLNSLENAARKTTEATRKLNDAYGSVLTQLNSHEMIKAIENAERLAVAMQSLADMQSHKLTFAVIDNK